MIRVLKQSIVVLLVALFSAATPADEIPVVTFTVTQFVVTGSNPLSDQLTAELLAPFTGDYAGLDGLLATVDALQAQLNQRGFAFRRVILPPQTLDGGVVELKIVAISINSVQVEGAEHFSSTNILRSVPGIQAGSAPDQKSLSSALELANRHPAKRLAVRLRESNTADAVDAIVDVEDRRPWQLFAGLNDIGTRNTGRTRVTAGAQHSNLFNLDHALTVSYTTSPENADDVMQAGASYDLPLYQARGRLSAFYSESDVDVGEISGFSVSGAGRFYGLSFTRLLSRHGAYSHEWRLGVQDRLFENNVDFLFRGTRLPLGVNVRSYPLNLGYSGRYEQRRFNLSFNLDYARNLGVGKRNDDRTYALARAGADPDWDVFRFDWEMNYFLPREWVLRLEMNGQLSTEPLIPGEQFGLGGAHSIRGLDERELVADSGLRLGVELISEPVPQLLGLRALGFVDSGYFDRAEPQSGELQDDGMASAGLGLRWQLRSLSIETSYAHVLDEGRGLLAGSPNIKGSRWHFSLFYVF